MFAIRESSAVCCAGQRKYFDDLWTEITLQAGLVLGAAVRPSWLRHYTKNLYLYNLSITDNTTQPGLEGDGGKTSDWSVIGNVTL